MFATSLVLFCPVLVKISRLEVSGTGKYPEVFKNSAQESNYTSQLDVDHAVNSRNNSLEFNTLSYSFETLRNRFQYPSCSLEHKLQKFPTFKNTCNLCTNMPPLLHTNSSNNEIYFPALKRGETEITFFKNYKLKARKLETDDIAMTLPSRRKLLDLQKCLSPPPRPRSPAWCYLRLAQI